MTISKKYRDLLEAAASRPQDQKAEVEAKDMPEETPEQGAMPGDTQKNRKADKSGELPAKGEMPTDQSTETASKATKDVDNTKMDHTKDSKKAAMESESDVDSVGDSIAEKVEAEVDIEKINSAIAEAAVFSVSDQLGGLLEAEGLDEEFKEKALTIFEAAVVEATSKHVQKIEEEVAEVVHEEVEAYKVTLDEQVESYLDYVVTEWMQENKLAIESSVKVEQAEAFMEGLKTLLDENYIDIPEAKVDIYEQEKAKRAEVEQELSEQVDHTIELQRQLKEAQKSLQVEKFVSELTVVEAEKIRSLAEGVEFEGEDSFLGKLGALKENYFSKSETVSKGSEDMIIEDESEETPAVSGNMSVYLSALKKG